MDRIVEIKVGGNHITKDARNAGVRGEANVTHLKIIFDASWAAYAKKVTFWDARGANPVERTLTTDYMDSTGAYTIPIPAEPLAEAGMMTFVIDGYIDGKRQRSMYDELEVKDAPIADNAGEPADPTPSQAEQLQQEIDGIIADIRNVKGAKEYMAEKGEAIEANATKAQESAAAAAQSASEASRSEASASESAAEAKKYRDEAKTILGGDFATMADLAKGLGTALKTATITYNGIGSMTTRPGASYDRDIVPLTAKPRMIAVYNTQSGRDEALLAIFPGQDITNFAKGLNIAIKIRHSVDFDVQLSGDIMSADDFYLAPGVSGWTLAGNAIYLNCYGATYTAVLFYE